MAAPETFASAIPRAEEFSNKLKEAEYKFMGCQTIRTCTAFRIPGDAELPRIRGIAAASTHLVVVDYANKKVKALPVKWFERVHAGSENEAFCLIEFDCAVSGLALLGGNASFLATTNGINELIICDTRNGKNRIHLRIIIPNNELKEAVYAHIYELRSGNLCVMFHGSRQVHLFDKSETPGDYRYRDCHQMDGPVRCLSYSRVLDTFAIVLRHELRLLNGELQPIRTFGSATLGLQHPSACNLTDFGLLTVWDAKTKDTLAVTVDGSAVQKMSHLRWPLYELFPVRRDQSDGASPDCIRMIFVEAFSQNEDARECWTIDEAIWVRVQQATGTGTGTGTGTDMNARCGVLCKRPVPRYIESTSGGRKVWLSVEMNDDAYAQFCQQRQSFNDHTLTTYLEQHANIVDRGLCEALPKVDRDRRIMRQRRMFHDIVLRS